MSASEVERAREDVTDAMAEVESAAQSWAHPLSGPQERERLAEARRDARQKIAAFEAAVRAEEREACARVADSVCASDPDVIAGEIGHPPCCHASDIAAAIRARGTA